MKPMEILKARELKLAKRINQFSRLVSYIQDKVNAWCKRSIKKFRDDLVKQQQIRDNRLALLALEQTRIRNEIIEIGEAVIKHGDSLEKY
jgi:hypothetical protein